ncbi:MAG: hypothetical protein ACLFOY_18165 [Desulfatibacillaceae bacterium]
MNELFLLVDSALIWLYRLPEIPILGYYLGTFVLALLCVVAGTLTVYAAHAVNGAVLKKTGEKMVDMQNASIHALAQKDKEAYKACNHEANEAFGRYFFSQIALGASSLWPAAFALTWMQGRFGEVEFVLPGPGWSVGFVFTFVLLYVLAHRLFSRVKRRLPLFAAAERYVGAHMPPAERMLTLSGLSRKKGRQQAPA